MDVKKYLTNRYYATALAILCSILWGATFPLLKIGYSEMQVSPRDTYAIMVLAGMRIFMASLLVLLFLKFIMRHSLKISRKEILQLLVLGIFQTLLALFFLYNGIAVATGIKGSVLASSSVFFIVLIAHFVYRDDRMDWRKVVGLIAGFVGIILVNKGKSGFNLDFTLYGEGFLVLSGLVTAIGNLMSKQLSKSINVFLMSGWQMFLGSILLTGIGLSGLESGAMIFTGKAWVLLIYLVVMTAVTFTLWFALLKYNKASEIALYAFILPLSGAIISVMCLPGEKFTVNILGAITLVILGITTVNYRKT